VPRHHDGGPDLRRVGAQVFDERLSVKPFTTNLTVLEAEFGMPGPSPARMEKAL
jgi:hypothetical protein